MLLLKHEIIFKNDFKNIFEIIQNTYSITYGLF